MSIPKIIHYCWFGGEDIPDESKQYIAEWKRLCPDYEIKRWDESNYDINKNRFIREAVKQKKWAFVSDYARLDVVNTYGGIYLDIDVQLLKNFDDLLDCKSFWGVERAFDRKTLYVNDGLGFGSVKENPFLDEIMALYMEYDDCNKEIKFTPCTMFQYDVFVKNGFIQKNIIQNLDGNIIYPEEYFAPKKSTGKIKVTRKTYSIHHYYATWADTCDAELKEYFRYVNMFGNYIGARVFLIIKKLKGKDKK